MKLIYWLRRLSLLIVFAIWIPVYIVLLINGYNSDLIMILLLLILVFISQALYPKKKDYCTCGNKYSKKIKFKETISSTGKVNKKGEQRKDYLHVFDVDCVCPNCRRTKTYEKKLNGGYEVFVGDKRIISNRIKPTIYTNNKNLLSKEDI